MVIVLFQRWSVDQPSEEMPLPGDFDSDREGGEPSQPRGCQGDCLSDIPPNKKAFEFMLVFIVN